jgi:hypothetical protein
LKKKIISFQIVDILEENLELSKRLLSTMDKYIEARQTFSIMFHITIRNPLLKILIIILYPPGACKIHEAEGAVRQGIRKNTIAVSETLKGILSIVLMRLSIKCST